MKERVISKLWPREVGQKAQFLGWHLIGLASYTTEELHAAVHKAHHFHLLTAAHCRGKESMVHAIEAGE